MDFPPQFGGVANYWANLCKCLPSEDLVVLAPERDNSLDFDIEQNYLIYRKNLLLKNSWPKWRPFFWSALNLIKKEKIEKIIVAQVLPGGTIALILKKIFRVPYILSFHGLDIALAQKNKRKKFLFNKIVKNSEQIIVNSCYTKELLKKNYTQSDIDNKIKVIYPCPNIKVDSLQSNLKIKEQIKTRINLSNKKILLTVGRLVKRKGHDMVLRALEKVVNKEPDFMYLIVGRGAEEDNLKEQIKTLGLTDKVAILNDIMNYELPSIYELADIFIMPSRQLADGDVEGFGIVYLEANLFGKPVIAGRSGGVVEAVKHNYSGLLVDPQNSNEIAQAIISLLENPQKAVQLGNQGCSRVKQEFTWRGQAQKLLQILM